MANPKLTKRDARLIRPAERSEALHLAGVDITPLVSADQSADYEIGVISGQEGHGPPPHSHPWDETYFVLRGEVVFGVGQDEQVFEHGKSGMPACDNDCFARLVKAKPMAFSSRYVN